LENPTSSLNEIRIIVAGTRTFSDYELLRSKLDDFVSKLKQKHPDKQVVIITGAAKGADKLGSLYARNHNIPLKEFPADWNTYGEGLPVQYEISRCQITHCMKSLCLSYFGMERAEEQKT